MKFAVVRREDNEPWQSVHSFLDGWGWSSRKDGEYRFISLKQLAVVGLGVPDEVTEESLDVAYDLIQEYIRSLPAPLPVQLTKSFKFPKFKGDLKKYPDLRHALTAVQPMTDPHNILMDDPWKPSS